jgi:hypothetical protein
MIPFTRRQRPNVGREAPVLAVEGNELLQVDGYGHARPLTAVQAPREPIVHSSETPALGKSRAN